MTKKKSFSAAMKSVATSATEHMRAFAVLAILLFPFLGMHSLAATSTPDGFTDNLDEALAAAKGNGKYVFVCFSGSDWCGWCKKLDREVFSKKKFIDGVTNDFELVFIDMPQDLTLLSERAQTENEKLVEKYAIQGFPTALVLESNGEILTKTGYREGGAKKYVQHLMEIRAKGPEIRVQEQLYGQHIAPVEQEIKRIIVSSILSKVQEAIEKLPKDEQEAKASELFAQYLPDAIVKIEAVLTEFKAKEVPELVAEEKEKMIKRAEEFLAQMKEEAAKKK